MAVVSDRFYKIHRLEADRLKISNTDGRISTSGVVVRLGGRLLAEGTDRKRVRLQVHEFWRALVAGDAAGDGADDINK